MKRIAAISTACALALLMTGCASQPDLRDADVQALKDVETQWVDAYAKKDVDKVLANYADDAVLMAPGAPAATTKEARAKEIKDLVADPNFSLKFTPSKVEVAKSGDIGYTQGSYQATLTDRTSKQKIDDHGSYLTTYRKDPSGTWKSVADVAISEVPPPSPAPADTKAAGAKKK